jgi:hypothetical protein
MTSPRRTVHPHEFAADIDLAHDLVVFALYLDDPPGETEIQGGTQGDVNLRIVAPFENGGNDQVVK